MNTKTLTILAVVALLAVVAAMLTLRPGATTPSDKPLATAAGASPVLGDLASRVAGVSTIVVKTAAAETTLEQVEGRWQVKEKSGYPADSGKVRGLLVGLTGLRNWEERTSRPDLYKTIGVDEPVKKEGAPETEVPRSILLTLKDQAGQTVASAIVGDTKWGQSPGAQGVYMRKPGEAKSYYADGKVEVPREPLGWINNEFVNVGRDRVWSVTVTPREHAEADRIVVVGEKPGIGPFAVQGVPEGKELKDRALSETVVAGLASTAFEDVAKSDTIDFAGAAGGKVGSAVQVRTWDGLIVNVETVQIGERWWWKLTASADPEPFKEGEGDAIKPRRTPEDVKKEVDELNARWANWAYAPFSYKTSAYARKLSEELKAPDAQPVTPAAPTQPGAVPALPSGLPVPPPAAAPQP